MVTTLPLGSFLLVRAEGLTDKLTECFVCREVMFVRAVDPKSCRHS